VTVIRVIQPDDPVRREIRQLADEGGNVSAFAVLEAARPDGSPLHDRFTWNDAEAAERYRFAQATALIRSCRLKVLEEAADGEVRQYLLREYQAGRNVGRTVPPGTYVAAESITDLERRILLSRMAREIAALRARYQALPEFWAALRSMMGEQDAAASGE